MTPLARAVDRFLRYNGIEGTLLALGEWGRHECNFPFPMDLELDEDVWLFYCLIPEVEPVLDDLHDKALPDEFWGDFSDSGVIEGETLTERKGSTISSVRNLMEWCRHLAFGVENEEHLLNTKLSPLWLFVLPSPPFLLYVLDGARKHFSSVILCSRSFGNCGTYCPLVGLGAWTAISVCWFFGRGFNYAHFDVGFCWFRWCCMVVRQIQNDRHADNPRKDGQRPTANCNHRQMDVDYRIGLQRCVFSRLHYTCLCDCVFTDMFLLGPAAALLYLSWLIRFGRRDRQRISEKDASDGREPKMPTDFPDEQEEIRIV